MADPLHELKLKLGRKYLGKAGIHAVGIRRSANALCVYISPSTREQNASILVSVAHDAAPFEVIFVEEEPPKLAT